MIGKKVKKYKEQAIQNTCEEFKISRSTVSRAITEMES
jgi:DNA-binding GntR family transcriptional regulator